MITRTRPAAAFPGRPDIKAGDVLLNVTVSSQPFITAFSFLKAGHLLVASWKERERNVEEEEIVIV